jgi:hypothetical protein
MPRNLNYLNHEDYPPEDDTHGWDYQPPGATYDVPIWMERMGMLELPDWMRTADGSCDVDYRIAMGTDRPQMYVTSLGEVAPGEEIALPKQPKCRFFAKNGRCKYGDNCYFSHEKPGTINNNETEVKRSRWLKESEVKKSYEQTAREAREKREDEQGLKVRACKYYVTYNGCKQGLACLNRHVDHFD